MKCSIILTSFNYGRYLDRAIKSALNQRFPSENFEVIVVDGGSTDNSFEILKKYKSKIRIINQLAFPDRKGLAAACNIGIESSKCEYIVRLDADDYFEENLLHETSTYLDRNPEIAFVYSDYYCVFDDKKKVRKKLPSFDAKEIHQRGDFLPLGTLYRVNCLQSIRFYNEGLRTLENFDLILRMIENNFIGKHIARPLFNYFIHDSSMSSDKDLMIKTGAMLGKKYGFEYMQNENHPRKF